MMKKIAFIIIGMGLFCMSHSASADEIKDIRDLCTLKPDIVHALFDEINLDYPGLEQVRKSAEKNDWPSACMALVEYYRNSDTATKLGGGEVKPSTERGKSADNILQDIFTFQSVTGKQPRTESGGLDWLYLGPRNDLEWAYFLNRHMIFVDLLKAWRATGDPRYSAHFDNLARDWVLANPAPEESEWTVNWRVLEAGLRMAWAWPEAFYGFMSADELSPVAVILMLSSVHGHAEYLQKYHWKEHNHAVMELFGLIKLALYWPEFNKSEEWLEYSMEHFYHELEFEVYPDGVQNELTSHYHGVPLVYFEGVMQLMERSGRPVPPNYRGTVMAMYNYYAYTMRPDGNGLLNNDSDLDYNLPKVKSAAKRYNRSDWLYITSNGSEGSRPVGAGSAVFPWAGQVVMRDGWDRDAQWAFFDAGPWGWSHQHNDKLHVSVSAYGRDILVDSGRYWYKPDSWRGYFISSQAHNVILINGMVQKPDLKLADKPMTDNYAILPEFDFAVGTYDKGFEVGKFTEEYGKEQIARATDKSVIDSPVVSDTKHTRAVVNLRGKYLVVADMIETGKPVEATALWHFHPDCTVEREGVSVCSTDEGMGNVRIVPAGEVDWDVHLVEGVENPSIQGWYSVRYNEKEANTVAAYTGEVSDNQVFAWVIIPAKGHVTAPDVKVLPSPPGSIRLSVYASGENPTEIAVRLSGASPVTVGNGLLLDGSCAVIPSEGDALVALGTLRDKQGNTIAEQEFRPYVPGNQR